MRRLATLAVVAALISPTTASGQDYSFGDWARDQGYSPGDVMPEWVDADHSSPAIDSLNGIGEFDWNTKPTRWLELSGNQLSNIESSAFSGLMSLESLNLDRNQLSSIESGDLGGLTNLRELWLSRNAAVHAEGVDEGQNAAGKGGRAKERALSHATSIVFGNA